MITDQVPGINELTREEKFALASELWDEIFDQEDKSFGSDGLQDLVAERWAEYLARPNNGATWESIRSKLGKS